MYTGTPPGPGHIAKIKDMNVLSKNLILDRPELVGGNAELLLNLPEKVLQFGTGVLLRALPDFIIDRANKAGIFNGRIVVVKSTGQGGTDAFARQDSLYTVCVRGISEGNLVKENVINTAVSRVLTASVQWEDILAFAESDSLEVVISNTTEVGIVAVEEEITTGVPASFPGKLLAVLYRRYRFIKGDANRGLVIVPTELISDNGDKLRKIVLDLARFNHLDDAFIAWLENHNTFCNSLVDRIVPGAPKGEMAAEIGQELPYEDELCIMSEPYALWAISGDTKVAEKLSFVQVKAGAFVEPDITRFKELKLRLLNGTHTLTCGLAYMAGFSTVKEAMNDGDFYTFLSDLMFKELAPSIPYALEKEESEAFGKQVIDRFKNPFIEHFWINITLNYTQKIEMRVVSLLQEYYRKNKAVPPYMAAGLAAYIRFMRPVAEKEGRWYGEFNGTEYLLQDQQAGVFAELYRQESPVGSILGRSAFWGGADLRDIPGLEEAVTQSLDTLNRQGARHLMQTIIGQ